DWLAREFVERGWSLKALHRLMVTSATYRQSSRDSVEAAKVDPENHLLWRMNRRRLEGEALRGAMLSGRGLFNLKAGGPSIPPGRAGRGEGPPGRLAGDEGCPRTQPAQRLHFRQKKLALSVLRRLRRSRQQRIVCPPTCFDERPAGADAAEQQDHAGHGEGV